MFTTEWGKDQTQQLKEMKELINDMQYDKLSEFKDVRVHLQALLEFFESLTTPAISMETVLQLEVDLKEKAIDGVYHVSNYFQFLKRTEFSILWEFSKYLNMLVEKNESLQSEARTFSIRVAISLLRKRKTLDRHFYSRNLIDLKVEDKQVILIAELIQSFSEYNSEVLMTEYVSSKSPIMRRDSACSSPLLSPQTDKKTANDKNKSHFFKMVAADP